MSDQFRPATISYSAVMSYVKCPEHYLFRYVLGIKNPPAKAMLRGTVFHQTLEDNYKMKLEGSSGMPLKDMQELYSHRLDLAYTDYQKDIEQARKLVHPDYLKNEAGVQVTLLKDSGVNGVAVYDDEVGKNLVPKIVEGYFRIDTNQNIALTGRIDVADKDDVLHDTKTTKRAPIRQEIEKDPQMATYQIGYEHLTGSKPKKYVKDYVVFNGKQARILKFEMEKPILTPDDVLRNVWNVLKGIQNNVWYCVHGANDWVCSEAYCGYWQLHKELREIGFDAMLAKYSIADKPIQEHGREQGEQDGVE